MEYLVQLLSTLTDDPAHTRLLFTAAMGIAITLFAAALLLVLAGISDPVRRRLGEVSGGSHRAATSPLARMVAPVSAYALPNKEAEISKMRGHLLHAGFRADSSLATFYAIKLLLAVSLPAIVLLLTRFFPQFSTLQVISFAVFGSFIGLILPNYLLSRRVKKRQQDILNGFPDALDLMVACTEAGLGLNGALQRVADELSISYPALTDELALVNAEIRAGVERTQALRNLADRTGIAEIRGLVSLLSQSMRFGTSIADSLRIYSEEFRDKRMQKAEEQAGKLAVKMIFPMILCIFPSFFLVAIGPALIGVMRAFEGVN